MMRYGVMVYDTETSKMDEWRNVTKVDGIISVNSYVECTWEIMFKNEAMRDVALKEMKEKFHTAVPLQKG